MASKFEKYLPEIIAARAAGKSWRQVVAMLAELGLPSNVSAVYEFFQGARRKRARITRELKPFAVAPALPQATASAERSEKSPQAAQSAEDPEKRRAAILERMAARAPAGGSPEEEARAAKIEATIANLPHNRIQRENQKTRTSDEKTK